MMVNLIYWKMMKKWKNKNSIPIKPPRLSYCNLTSIKYNILSPHKKSICKTHDEITNIYPEFAKKLKVEILFLDNLLEDK